MSSNSSSSSGGGVGAQRGRPKKSGPGEPLAVPKSFSGAFADVHILKLVFGADATSASIPENYSINELEVQRLQETVRTHASLGPQFVTLISKANLEKRYQSIFQNLQKTGAQKAEEKVAAKTKREDAAAAKVEASKLAEIKKQEQLIVKLRLEIGGNQRFEAIEQYIQRLQSVVNVYKKRFNGSEDDDDEDDDDENEESEGYGDETFLSDDAQLVQMLLTAPTNQVPALYATSFDSITEGSDEFEGIPEEERNGEDFTVISYLQAATACRTYPNACGM